MPDTPNPNPLEIDDDWKNKAQQEKEALAGHAAAPPPPPPPAAPDSAAPPAAAAAAPAAPAQPAAEPPPQHRMPAPSFDLLVQQMVTQILLALGEIAHPVTRKRSRDLVVAKHYIDMLGVLEAKTKNNLTQDEQRLLDSALYEMRMHYVSAVKLR